MKKYPLVRGVAGSLAAPAQTRCLTIPGSSGASGRAWEPALHALEQASGKADRRRPVLYVHGATFPSANSVMFKFGGTSWADELNSAGFAVWGFDFAGFGESERYPDMATAVPSEGAPLGRAPEAARQIERVVHAIVAETGVSRVSIVAHSWGTMATGLFATEHPEWVERLVFFGPITRREVLKNVPALGPWRLLTVEEQHQRFVEDVPPNHPPVLMEREFPSWAARYLDSDPTSRTRTPPSVKTPNGPVADIMSAWSGTLAYDPAGIKAPTAIVRGEWDSLCQDGDVAWLLAAMSGTAEKKDTKIAKATHLMHLEENRGDLYRAATAFLLNQ